jgi:hypothetical protein
MYLVGGPHPHKADAQLLLERAVRDERRLVTDAEVFQEILHRYVAINRRDAIQPAFDALTGVVDTVYGVEREDVESAKEILYGTPRFSARDALHVAIMRRHGIEELMSFDSGFDDLPGIRRLSA